MVGIAHPTNFWPLQSSGLIDDTPYVIAHTFGELLLS